MKKQSLLCVITQAGPWGGAQRYIADLALSLDTTYEISVAIGDPKGLHDLRTLLKNKHFSGLIIQLNHLVRPISPAHDLLAIVELTKLYRRLGPDIVHLNSSKAGVIGSIAVRLLPKKIRPSVIYTVHGWAFDEPGTWIKKTAYRIAEWITQSLKDRFVVLSLSDEKRAEKALKIPRKKLTIIPHGISLAKEEISRDECRKMLEQKTGSLKGTFWIGTIANHYQTKGLDTLVSALYRLHLEKPKAEWQAIIVGDGPERPRLERQIAASGLSHRITLAGFLDDAAHLLPAFDLFVLPSKKEGLPYVILEAFANHVPVIATDVGGVSALVINKKTGLLIPKENPIALADAIRFAFENPEETQQMAEGALVHARKNFGTEGMMKKTERLYQSLVSSL